MTGMKGWLGTSGPWVLAGLLWTVSVLTSIRAIREDTHGLCDCAALVVTFWAIVRQNRGPRIRPGYRVITDEMMTRIEDTAFRAALIAVKQGSTERPTLRAVSGD